MSAESDMLSAINAAETAVVQLAAAYTAYSNAYASGMVGTTPVSGSGSATTTVYGMRQQGFDDQVDIRVGTLSKALGGHGGFVAGSQRLIDWLSNRARPYVFSTAAPPANAEVSNAVFVPPEVLDISGIGRRGDRRGGCSGVRWRSL